MFRIIRILFVSFGFLFVPPAGGFVLSYMKVVHIVAFILLVVGGLNWGLVGIGGEGGKVVAVLGDAIARAVYVLVGIAAIVEVVTHKKSCTACASCAPVSTGGTV